MRRQINMEKGEIKSQFIGAIWGIEKYLFSNLEMTFLCYFLTNFSSLKVYDYYKMV